MRKLMDKFGLEFWFCIGLLGFMFLFDTIFTAIYGKGLGILLFY